MPSLEERVDAIEKRNKRVSLDKSWEQSFERKAVLAALTYVVVAIFLMAINAEQPLQSALVPAGAFVFSTMTMSALKRMWLKRHGGE